MAPSDVVSGFGDLAQELAQVRALRATPPRLAGEDDDRRRVFGAALQQFEELIVASERSGLASAPCRVG